MNFWSALVIIVVAFFITSVVSYFIQSKHKEEMRELAIDELRLQIELNNLTKKEEKNKKGKTKKDEDGKVK